MGSTNSRRGNIEIIEFIKSADTPTILNGLDSEGTPWLNHVFRIYQNYVGETCTTCPSKIMGYIDFIKHLKPEQMSNTDKKYVLQEGAMIIEFGGQAYTNANLTDEIAAKLLAKNPNREVLFAKMPSQEEMVVKVIDKPLSKMTKSELLEKALGLGITKEETAGKTNAELVEMIESASSLTEEVEENIEQTDEVEDNTGENSEVSEEEIA